MKTVLLLAILLSIVGAQPATAQDMKAWEQALQDGAEAFEAKDYETALLRYSEAQQILDVPKLRLQVALVHEKLGQCRAAHALLESLVDDEQADKPTREFASAQLGMKCESRDEEPQDIEIVIVEQGEVPQTGQRDRKRAGWVWLAAGSAGIVAGTLLVLDVFVPPNVSQCSGADGAISCTRFQERRGLTDSEPLELRDAARRTMLVHRVIGISTAALSAFAVAIGLKLLLTRGPTTRSVALRATAGGLEFVW